MIFKQIHKQLKVHTLLILYISHVQRQVTIKLKQSKNKKINFIQNNVEKKILEKTKVITPMIDYL